MDNITCECGGLLNLVEIWHLDNKGYSKTAPNICKLVCIKCDAEASAETLETVLDIKSHQSSY